MVFGIPRVELLLFVIAGLLSVIVYYVADISVTPSALFRRYFENSRGGD
jgi:hypothetical protein